jgi:hypothetical protein
MMKFALLVLVWSFAGSFAHAYDRQDMMEATGMLQEQLLKIDKLGGKTCPEEQLKLSSAPDLRISLFYGYENYDEITADGFHAIAMAKALQRKCFGNIEACGFHVVSHAPNFVQLARVINGRPISIDIHSTSVTESDKANSNFGSDQWAQYAQSAISWRDFHRALRNSDVVFYSGHSRLGAGLGFNIESFGQEAMNYVFKAPLKATLAALSARPSRLKVLGLFACSTDEYYKKAMQQANPNMDMIVSKKEISGEQGEQMSIATINSILGQRCKRDYRKSMNSTVEPAPGLMEYVRSAR